MGFENGKLLRVVLRAQRNADGEQQVNTLHYNLDDSLLNADNDPQALADAFRDAVMPKQAACYDNTWTIQPVEVVQELDPQHVTAARSAWTSGSPTVGVRSTAAERLPVASCGVVSLRTEHIGRRARGRMFLGGTLTELDQNAGVWQSSILAIWQQLLDAIPHQPDLATGTSDSVADWVVYSRTNRAADVDPYASKVTTPVLRTAVRWLRSRQQ